MLHHRFLRLWKGLSLIRLQTEALLPMMMMKMLSGENVALADEPRERRSDVEMRRYGRGIAATAAAVRRPIGYHDGRHITHLPRWRSEAVGFKRFVASERWRRDVDC